MIDIKKKYKTKDGNEVRIYATDGEGEHPIHGSELNCLGWSEPHTWTLSGKYFGGHAESVTDLIEVKTKVKYLKSIRQILEENPDCMMSKIKRIVGAL